MRALLLLLAPLGVGQPGPAAVHSGQGSKERQTAPVLLVPGARRNRSSLIFLRAFLVHRGWPWVWAVNVGSRDSTVADMAAQLAKRVETLTRSAHTPQVDIVGHGTGGLAAAWYVQHLDGASRVRRLVTLGTPWRGTRMAVFRNGTTAREVDYGAPVLDGLAPPAVPTVSVWSDDDPIVVPSRSAIPEGMESVRIEGAGHADMLASSRVFRAVQAALSHPLPPGAQ